MQPTWRQQGSSTQGMLHGCKPPDTTEYMDARMEVRTMPGLCPYPCAPLTSHRARGAIPTYLPRAALKPGANPNVLQPFSQPQKASPYPNSGQKRASACNAVISSSVQSSPGFYLCTRYTEASCRGQLAPALRSIPACPPLHRRPHLNQGCFIFYGAQGDAGRCPHPTASSPARAPMGAGEEG